MAAGDFWDDRPSALRTIAALKKIQNWTGPLAEAGNRLSDGAAALELLETEEDGGMRADAEKTLTWLEKTLSDLEFRQMLSGPHDQSDTILTIRSGAGGIDSQDWAEMLLRMYVYWAERQGFEVEVLSTSEGEEAGIREGVLSVRGPYSFGYMKAERGIHRLVRRSPFDQNHRRHTSFASVLPLPDLEESVELEIDEEDVRVDVYRASGAGGQHVNKTSSAIRLTHIPTGIVASCQNERSQHRNREVAWRILRARLYELEEEKRRKEREKLEGVKQDVSWGNQIRSYVLHPYQMVKDHRTGMETSAVEAFLAGDIQEFIQTYLKENGGR
jgi:peptide chain release factor 2